MQVAVFQFTIKSTVIKHNLHLQKEINFRPRQYEATLILVGHAAATVQSIRPMKNQTCLHTGWHSSYVY